MIKTEVITLIDGDFDEKEAKEILVNIFSSKINFHQVKNFSSQEKYGKVDAHAEKRIIALKKGLERALEILLEAQKNNNRLTINAEVNITITGK
jgi:hypothetical protein